MMFYPANAIIMKTHTELEDEYFMPTVPFHWIWTSLPYEDSKPEICYFRKKLTLKSRPRKASCRLSADSRYCFYVNGRLVCRGPRKGDGKIWFYDEADLTPFLKDGENVLAAVVLRYPQDIGRGNRSVWRTEKPAFAAEGTFEDTDGIKSWFTDKDWKTCLADHIRIHADYPETSRLYIQEEVRGNASFRDWMMPGFDDSSWADARCYEGGAISAAVSPGFLRSRPIPFLYEKPCRFASAFRLVNSAFSGQDWEDLLQKDQNLTIPPHSLEIVELIADRNTTGYLTLALAGGAGSRVELLEAESYSRPSDNPQGPFKEDRLDWQNGALEGPADTYYPGGYGTASQPEIYEPFWFRTFRFIRLSVTTLEAPLTLCRFTYRETGYPLEVKTKVTTSDPTLCDIWKISENSLRACMQETYVDCPFYEQLQYAMDSRSEMLFTYACSGDDRLARETLDDFARSQRADGLINACYPTCKPNVIPEFSIYYILMLHDHMMYFGDAVLIRRYFPVAERILNFFSDLLTPEGLVGQIPGTQMPGGSYWGFVDWAEGWPVGVPPAAGKGPLTMDSLMFCLGLQKAAGLADFLGWANQADEYRTMSARLKQAVRKHCTGKNGFLTDGPGLSALSQHVQVFAVLTEALTGDEAKGALLYTLKHPELPRCSVAMGYYLFRALEKTNLYEYTDKLWDKWRSMLSNHLTTCQESDGCYVRSDCHGWGALALYELPAVILGIRPGSPGFASVRFSPVPGVLTHAEGEVITPRGLIKACWRMENGEIKKEISLPEGMSMTDPN